MIFIILFLAACFLAFSNGANDNFKGVATLFGSGTSNYKNAINWATITTFAGAVAAIFLAETLVKNFSGKGLVPDTLIRNPEFAIAIALGAALTVFLATKIGMPISTTHALVGGLFGAGVMAIGYDFNFDKLGKVFLIPLVLSPFMAAAGSFLAYLVLRSLRSGLRVKKKSCICIGESSKIELAGNQNYMQLKESVKVTVCAKGCENQYEGRFVGISAQNILDTLHFISGGVVSFARGLNDTPKIVGLLIIIKAINIKWGMIAVAVTMAIGGLLNA